MGGGVAVIVPARLASTRFPRKLLARVAGRTILEWTWRRARAVPGTRGVWIATDSAEIAGEVRAFGGEVLMTGEQPSGTDRVAAAARSLSPAPEGVVNLQGDEPLIAPATIGEVCAALRESGDALITCSAPLRDHREWVDPAVVKVVVNGQGEALYFSRAPIPATQDGPTPAAFERARVAGRAHVGIYGYPLALLVKLRGLPVAALEQIESLEQLRALAAGVRIRVVAVAGRTQAVDTPEDLERVRPALEAEAARAGASGV